MEKFHITIKNNETGEIIVDLDTCAIVGAIAEYDRIRCIGSVYCSASRLADTLAGAAQVVNTCRSRLPKGLRRMSKKK